MKQLHPSPSNTQPAFRNTHNQGPFDNITTTSTLYSLRTGKRIKTQSQIQQQIKTKRAKSYQLLSRSIRNMEQLFLGEYSKNAGNDNQTQKLPEEKNHNDNKTSKIIRKRPFFWENPEKERTSSNKTVKINTCQFINQEPQIRTKNIVFRGQLIESMPLKTIGTSHRKNPMLKNTRIKTDYNEADQHQIQHQLILRKQTKNQSQTILGSKTTASSQIFTFSRIHQVPGVEFKQSQEQKNSIEEQKHRKSHSHTKSHFQLTNSYLHQNQLLQKDDDHTIKEMYQLRSHKKLTECPKQWHLYNCLKLNQLSLYRTNLKLSCQQWILIDYLQLKYLRGWYPKQVRYFDIAIKLFASHMLFQLKKTNHVDYQKVKIKINNSVIRNKLSSTSAVLIDSNFSLKNNTIISLWDLCAAMLITNNEDLIWHLIYALSYLQRFCNFQPDHQQIHQIPEQIYIPTDQQLIKQLDRLFLEKSKEIITALNLNSTTLTLRRKKHELVNNHKGVWAENYQHSIFKENNQYQHLVIETNCLDAAVLFMDCLSHPPFLQLLQKSYPTHQSSIKFQVGYKFWENRTHTWKNQFTIYRNKGFVVLTGRNSQSKTLSIISFHLQDQAVIICNDCKLNMCLRDICSIESWMRQTFKRFNPCRTKKDIVHIQNLEAEQ